MTYNDIKPYVIVMFRFGSKVYGTNSEQSDNDLIVIVEDCVDTTSENNNILTFHEGNNDYQVITDSHFKEMIKNHHIVALESLWMHESNYSDLNTFNERYLTLFKLDKWKLRQTISGICNNAWAKCHKKLTVEKDYDYYRAIKSLFHVIRLFIFGRQIAEYGHIADYSAANFYWIEIKNQESHEWEDYKKIYQPIVNNLRSEFVKLCPKPV